MEKYLVNKEINDLDIRLKDLITAIKPDSLKVLLSELDDKMKDSLFWSNTKNAKGISKNASMISTKLETLEALKKEYKNLLEWYEISEEGSEEWQLLEEYISDFKSNLREMEIKTLLSGPYDNNECIMEIHPGAGGTESQDFAEMLYRMYCRYINKRNFKMKVLDYQNGDDAGIKSVTFLVSGDYAYGYLKCEKGVHRLVRISPFDANSKRHTSFVSVEVTPKIDEDLLIEIKDEDLKIDVYRSGGAGGQSVNTTDSAVRVTHLKTGIVVTCQNERSQLLNKETALNILKSKLLKLEIQKREDEINKEKGTLKDIAWGSQIRSYVFHPYQLVKDHRTNYEVGNANSVIDGNLDEFINAYLKAVK